MATKKNGVSGGFASLPRDNRLTLSDRKLRVEVADLSKPSDEFALSFFEDTVRKDPCHEEALIILGHVYTARGEHQKGLEIDQRLVKLRPQDPVAFYNLGCSHSLLSQLDAALEVLDKAMRLGFGPLERIEQDPDLANVRESPRYPEFLASWQARLREA